MDDDGLMMSNQQHRHPLYPIAKDLFEAEDDVVKHEWDTDSEEEEGGSSDDDLDRHWRYGVTDDFDRYDWKARGVAVTRWKVLPPPAPGLSAEPWFSGGRVNWLALPQCVTCQIAAKLPFPEFCCFRLVCKEWSAVIPDFRAMSKFNAPPPLPVCVMHWSACYNPSTHDWQRLPTSFHPWGRRIVATCEGLLLLRSEGRTLELWVVNPVNNSEKKLPGTSRFRKQGPTHELNFELRLTEDKSSFQVYHVIGCGRRGSGAPRSRVSVEIYDSETNSWSRAGFLRDVDWVCSVIDFKNALYALVFEKNHPDFPFVVKIWRDGNNAYGRLWRAETILCQRRIQGGQFFVRNGKLSLAVVLCSKSRFEDEAYLYSPPAPDVPEPRPRMVCVWEMDERRQPFGFHWKDIVAMPYEFPDKLVAGAWLHVDVCGDFLWISSKNRLIKKLGGQTYESLFVFSGVMCHIPSNTWWELPHFRESPLYRTHYEAYVKERGTNENDNRSLDVAWKALYRSLREVFDILLMKKLSSRGFYTKSMIELPWSYIKGKALEQRYFMWMVSVTG